MQLQLILNKGLKEPFLLHGPKNYVTREMEDHSGGLLFLKLLVVLITIILKKFMSLTGTKYMMECLNDATAYGAGSASCCSNQDVMLGNTNKLSTSPEDSLRRSALMTIVL
ncbi:hypothetical protein HanXRQr2_Chr09g0375381 [Helianthus annuus]|uniref:Uncharacterized protein n=1 Tax=Helianthus annuus TaxID=4232 RepID=A0A9K3I3I7_HELAN|nr:hypothetical protein HanXRQr2_Chr09g0375381 [Helianthus annuus]KAJ0892103.1 hypothetical protein HanPSC8_Chr09g0361881 [Helianthus annuus]